MLSPPNVMARRRRKRGRGITLQTSPSAGWFIHRVPTVGLPAPITRLPKMLYAFPKGWGRTPKLKAKKPKSQTMWQETRSRRGFTRGGRHSRRGRIPSRAIGGPRTSPFAWPRPLEATDQGDDDLSVAGTIGKLEISMLCQCCTGTEWRCQL